MIEIKINNRDIFEYMCFDDEVLSMKDFGHDIINKKLNGRPCIGEFEPIEWSVWALKQEIHDSLPPYDLYQKTELTKDGLEHVFCIHFYGDEESELYFKLKYLNA